MTNNISNVSESQDKIVASRFLRYQMSRTVGEWLPADRVAKCHRKPLHRSSVVILQSNQTKRARYGGLMCCGSIWLCPLCAHRISDHRRIEIDKLFIESQRLGYTVTMLTLTIPHQFNHALETLSDTIYQSYRSLIYSVVYRDVKRDLGIIGLVRSFEITHGSNGWHPHYHILIVSKNDVYIDFYQTLLRNEWIDIHANHSLPLPNNHGLTLQLVHNLADYMTKTGSTWTVSAEITKQHIKTAKNGSLTPFDLIRSGNKKLFLQYAKYIKYHRQLVWSPGLKKHFQLLEITDQDIVASHTSDYEYLGSLSSEQWLVIDRSMSAAVVLTLVEQGGWDSIIDYIKNLLDKFK